jgi:hypothetical protein
LLLIEEAERQAEPPAPNGFDELDRRLYAVKPRRTGH